jgi:hypothetical protein
LSVLSAFLLTFCAIASQSIGAILLAALGVVWLLMSDRVRRVTLISGALLFVAGGAFYLSGKQTVEHIAYRTSVGQAALSVLKASQRGSLSWRVHRDVEALGLIGSTAFTGHGHWDWWRPLRSHPWGLPLLLAGQYGFLSLALLAIALMSGALRALWRGSGAVLPVIILLSAIDAQLNSFLYFNAILAAAAIATRHPTVRRSPRGTFPPPSPEPEPA